MSLYIRDALVGATILVLKLLEVLKYKLLILALCLGSLYLVLLRLLHSLEILYYALGNARLVGVLPCGWCHGLGVESLFYLLAKLAYSVVVLSTLTLKILIIQVGVWILVFAVVGMGRIVLRGLLSGSGVVVGRYILCVLGVSLLVFAIALVLAVAIGFGGRRHVEVGIKAKTGHEH